MIMGSSNRHRRKGARPTLRRLRALGGAFCLLTLGLTVAPMPAGGGGWARSATASAAAARSAAAAASAASAAAAASAASAAEATVTLPQAQSNLSLAWAVPDYPVGHQLLWLLSVATQAPVPVAELKAHFDAQFLAAVAPATLNDDLVGLKLRAPLSVTSLEAPSPPSAGLGSGTSLLGAGLSWGNSALSLLIGVDGKGLISTLRVAPAPALPAAPTTWAGLDTQLRSLAPDVSFEAATLGTGATASPSGACHVLNALAPAAPRPLGSMFKLYVLATLASEVRSGQLSWDQEVPLTASLRSLPSGFLQVEPPGTRFSVSQLAQIMVPNSDNTAADRLAALVGRTAIEAQVATTSAHASLDTPFLRTRELFVLKADGYPNYARAVSRPPGLQAHGIPRRRG